ncbi:TlpA family protein disulfide reductase [Pedobacter nyackensis]|nr:TlpA disulfide reductase family protein [Pedobacter nyackensis]
MASITDIHAQSPVEIKGVFSSGKGTQIKLFQTDEGTTSEVAQIKVKDDGTFRFAFFPEYEGLYALGTGSSGLPSSDMIFYLKGGDCLELGLIDNGYTLQGSINSKENQILSKWNKVSSEVRQQSGEKKQGSAVIDAKAFFPAVERLNNASTKFVKENKSNNRRFDQFLPKVVRWDIARFVGNYLNNSPKGNLNPALYTPSVKALKATDYSKSAQEVYKFPFGNQTIKLLTQMEVMKAEKQIPEGINGLEQRLRFIQSDTLKGDEVLSYLALQKSYRPFTEATNKYGSYFVTAKQKQLFNTYKLQFDEFKPGDLGFQFSYPDKNDKVVKLNDFKGKVVVIDVWATWCGPCIKEIPFMKKLEESLKGKDVAFIGMSTDAEKDKSKWLKMIEEEGMKGVQLLAGQGNEFSKFYKIGSIPRFLVFDKKGNLVTANAPRPSNPDLKSIIEEELKY